MENTMAEKSDATNVIVAYALVGFAAVGVYAVITAGGNRFVNRLHNRQMRKIANNEKAALFGE